MSKANPAGTDGFAFLEFTTLDKHTLLQQMLSMGFELVCEHQDFNVILLRQNDIFFVINTDTQSAATAYAKAHGPSVSAMGFKVKNAEQAFSQVINAGAKAVEFKAFRDIYEIPAIYGIGNTLIYFVDEQDGQLNFLRRFSKPIHSHPGIGLTYLDHVTHNLYRGNMSIWADFYSDLFGFREIRYFDIEGKLTGLKSKAMTSPCGKIRIPLNESADDQSQIEEFLHVFNGEGIQHIALGTDDIYNSIQSLRQRNLDFLDTPETYYDLIEKRLPNHGEPIELLRKLRILIDGDTRQDKKLLLQIFTQNMLGPVFFEIIQRKGDEGFGEGNFRALFESIELDQIRRGTLTVKQEETSIS